MRKYILIIILILAFGVPVVAQNEGMLNLNLSGSLPLGTSNQFFDKAGVTGFLIDGRIRISDQFTIGGIIGGDYFTKDFGLVTEENGNTTVYGYKQVSSSVMPLMMTVHYYFFKKRREVPYNSKEIIPSMIRPYIGIDFGGFNVVSHNFLGNSSYSNEYWLTGFAPEVGTIIFFRKDSNFGVNISCKYYITGQTNDIPSTSWLGINLGFSYLF